MTEVVVTADSIIVRFSRSEKLLGLVRDTEIPLSAVREVAVVPDGEKATTGLRAPGLAIPGRRKIGTWRGRGRRALVSVSGKEPALRLSLSGHRYDEVLVGTPGATALAARIRRHSPVV